MFGKIGDMMGKLQEMKQRAEEIKSKLDEVVISTEGAGGDIKIEITGNREIKNIKISDTLQHGDKLELQKQLLVTINKAITEASKVNESEMKKAATGLLPGM
ncbi:YbaB/EbfC family nucleoid-associated protein [Aurantibacillus circumpalustris]|uniref:YbaB/EbfC family nucleoid-associated protein n=1 Tax=Aurantibacillus circumpalustris TaxID=3036359 RepID=UPI00295C2F26|nr:YbaB/EbfC family nucleoid-associated protein [Aurantibacillus circumpalustris]